MHGVTFFFFFFFFFELANRTAAGENFDRVHFGRLFLRVITHVDLQRGMSLLEWCGGCRDRAAAGEDFGWVDSHIAARCGQKLV